ncbi:MAG: flagellar motor switch protein FliN [Firmicutes bacterium]|nr:flagellar motor switch protein FliN [Bacillota bacterium]
MSDHILSQEEIDALLKGESEQAESQSSASSSEDVSGLFERALDRAVAISRPIAGQSWRVKAVTVENSRWGDVRQQYTTPLVARWDYQGDVTGVQVTIVDSSVAERLAQLSPGEDPAAILNKLALALATGLEQELGVRLAPQIGGFRPEDCAKPDGFPLQDEEPCTVVRVELASDRGELAWIEVLPSAIASDLVRRLAPTGAPASPGTKSEPAPGVTVHAAQFAPLEGSPPSPQPANIGLILDVPLQVTVELGRRRMLIRDVLELGKGSLIELDKLAGEPVDVFVNGKLIAKGEVVVIDENFGVKVTSIVTPMERVQNLQ